MQTPESFKVDLWSAYTGDLSEDDLIRNHELFLRRLARHALRYRTHWMVSDEDDMFQEACVWMIKLMWNWDSTRGTELWKYVVYNVGTRLQTQVLSERTSCRHPDANKSRKVDIWDTSNEIGIPPIEMITGDAENPEVLAAIHQALDRADRELTALARQLVDVLLATDGNLTAAARLLMRRKDIRDRFGPDEKHLRYVLVRRVMPEIFKTLAPAHIIPARQPSNG